VLDLGHLRSYTQDSSDLERELLGLLRVQLREQLLAILGAADAQQWKFATHTLKGAARALGAWQVAEAALGLETVGFAAAAGEKAVLIARLEADITACERVIDDLL
jgi:HPt (histidine-containing phosphotransfer) domain-containing protein